MCTDMRIVDAGDVFWKACKLTEKRKGNKGTIEECTELHCAKLKAREKSTVRRSTARTTKAVRKPSTASVHA